MGLAANQARLLTLQSRMNDLELRCMQISNQKITNSIKSSNASIAYNERLQEINNSKEYAPEYVTQSYTETEGWTTNSKTSTTLKLNKDGNKVSFDYNTLKGMGYDIAPKGSVANVTNVVRRNNVGGSATTTKTVTTPATDNFGRKNVTGWQMPETAAEFKKLMQSAGLVANSTSNGDASQQTLVLNKWLGTNGAVKAEDLGMSGSPNSLKNHVAAFTVDGTASDDPDAKVNFDRAKLTELLGCEPTEEVPNRTETKAYGTTSKSIEAGNYDMPTTMRELMNLFKGVGLIGTPTTSYEYEGGPLSDARAQSKLTFQLNGFEQVNENQYYSMADFAKMFAKNASDVEDNKYDKAIEFDYNKLAAVIGTSDKIGAAETTFTTSARDYKGVTSFGETSKTVEVPAEETTSNEQAQPSISYSTNDVVENAKKDSQALIEGILNGTIGIYKNGEEVDLSEVGLEKETTTTTGESEKSYSSSTVKTLDYTKRDNARQEAQNEYDAKVKQLSAEDKKLDLLLKTANTEYSAASTEYESVKSLISDNTERGFSIWS